MAGTKAGGLKAKKANTERDPDFYSKIGRKGGTAKHNSPRWFELHPELAVIAGAKGGRISRRGAPKNPTKTGLSAGLTPGSRTRRKNEKAKTVRTI
jgi:general stress protein YciG